MGNTFLAICCSDRLHKSSVFTLSRIGKLELVS